MVRDLKKQFVLQKHTDKQNFTFKGYSIVHDVFSEKKEIVYFLLCL